ncbi:MAG: HEAT repeat domain-containing protein [Pseudomonadota bacterium]
MASVRRAAGAALLALSMFAPGPALVNGWEHWGIPLDVLMGALAGDQSEYQAAAARSLGFRRERSALPRLLGLIDRPETPGPVASAVIEALGRIGDASAAPTLTRMLATSSQDELRGDAAAALGAIGDETSLAALLEALARDSSLIVRARIVEALGAFRQEPAVEAVARVVEESRNRSLRLRAIRALGQAGAAAPLVKALAAAREDGERGEIVDALARTRAPEAGAPLARLLAAGPGLELRVRIAVALGAIGDGSVVPTLIRLLDDDEIAVRFHAVLGLAEAGDARAAAPLRALDRRLAERAGARDERAILSAPAAHLAELALRVEVLAALAALDAPGSIDAFAAALAPAAFARDSALALRRGEGEYERRRAAIVGLGAAKSPAAARLLAERGLLDDADFRLRAAAVRALGAIGAYGAAALLPRLDDEAAEVRWEAAFVLGRLADRQAIEPLKARLVDPHPEVRRQAALGLAYLGAREAMPALSTLAREDPSEAVRAAAAAALAALARPR